MSAPGVAMDDALAKDRARIGRQLDAAAVLLKSEIQAQLSKPGTGKLYRRRKVRYSNVKQDGKRLFVTRQKDKASDFHQASAPGNPPAQDTGALKQSAFVERSGPLSRSIGVSKVYAAPLELEKNRPFMEPAKVSWRAKVGALFAS